MKTTRETLDSIIASCKIFSSRIKNYFPLLPDNFSIVGRPILRGYQGPPPKSPRPEPQTLCLDNANLTPDTSKEILYACVRSKPYIV